MKRNILIGVLCVSILLVLVLEGFLCFYYGKNSVQIEGIRSGTYCNDTYSGDAPRFVIVEDMVYDMAEDIDDIAEDSDGIAEEEADEESNPTYTYTYTFYNTSPFENHFDIYGELNMLTPNCAILTDQNDEFFAYLTVIDDVAVLITDSETKYELNYCGEDMIIQIDRTGWYEKYGSQYD